MTKANSLEFLKELIRIDSSNPPGRERKICEYLLKLFSREGIPGKLIYFAPDRPSFCSCLPGKSPEAIVLSGHLDTVAPLGTWSRDPFAPLEEEGKVFGLGACDMKAGVAVLLDLFFRISLKGRPKYSLKLLLSADEEDRYRGAEAFRNVGLLEEAAFVIVAEPTDARPMVGEKSEFWVRTHFKGREAHGSTPEKGINAVLAQARFLLELEKRLQGLSSSPVMGRPTLNVGKIQGGRQPNIVPEACAAELDFRLISEEQKKEVISIMEDLGRNILPGASFTWETISYKPALLSSLNDPLIMEFLEAFRASTGDEPSPGAVTFCTDLPTLFPVNHPPFVIFGPGSIFQAHQPDEFVEIHSIKKASRVLEAFLHRVLYP